MVNWYASVSIAAKIASFSPYHDWVTAVEKTLATTMGVKVRREKSRRMISMTKKTPAMGALKTEAMPAAAPHPSNVVACSRVMPRIWAREEPITDPIWTMGPSAPAEPPEPMVAAEAWGRSLVVVLLVSMALETGYAMAFHRAVEGRTTGDDGVWFATADEPRFRRVNRVTAWANVALYAYLLALLLWTAVAP